METHTERVPKVTMARCEEGGDKAGRRDARVFSLSVETESQGTDKRKPGPSQAPGGEKKVGK